jgi:hypothetical protein
MIIQAETCKLTITHIKVVKGLWSQKYLAQSQDAIEEEGI